MTFIAIQALVWIPMLILIVVFGVRAYRKRQEETFERRDN